VHRYLLISCILCAAPTLTRRPVPVKHYYFFRYHVLKVLLFSESFFIKCHKHCTAGLLEWQYASLEQLPGEFDLQHWESASPFPKTLRKFQVCHPKESRQDYLAACLCPDGFVRPRLGKSARL
jgi:hypothetical protein